MSAETTTRNYRVRNRIPTRLGINEGGYTMACSVGSLNIEHPNQLSLRFFQFCLVRPHNDGVYPISPSGASISDQESFATLDFISFVIIE